MESAECYIERACKYLGIDRDDIVRARIENDELVIIYDLGVQGCPKMRIPLSTLRAIDPLSDLSVIEPDENIAISATDAALRLIEQHQISALDIVDFIDEDRRITVRDVRDFIKGLEQ